MQKAYTESHKPVDWTSIATEFYDTAKSIRSIAQAVGVSETAIRKHAKRHGWHRPSAVAHAETRCVSHLADALEFRRRPEFAMRSDAMKRAMSLRAELGLGPASKSKVAAEKKPERNPFMDL
jgi:transposase-like protein